MATLEKSATTTIDKTALGRLEREGRLLNAVLKSPTKKPGRFGFRGDIALKFQPQFADEKRPPDFSIEQVLPLPRKAKLPSRSWRGIYIPSRIWTCWPVCSMAS